MAGGVDFATLGLRVDGTGLERFNNELERMVALGGRAEQATTRSTVGFGRLNGALTTLATRAAGTDPVVGRLVATLSTFAIGSVAMTGVLAGVAAIGLAWRKLGEEARTAEERLKAASRTLQEISNNQRFAGIGGDVGVAVRLNIQEVNRLRARQGALLNRGVTSAPRYDRFGEEIGGAERREYARNEDEIARLQGLISAGQRDVTDRDINERQRTATAQLRSFLTRLPDLTPQAGTPAGRTFSQITPGMPGVDTHLDFGQIAGFRQIWEAQEQAARKRNEYDARALELDHARSRANEALVLSLMNVGRAYGGVTDQVIALAAAAWSVARMPGYGKGEMATGGDRNRALGASALAGIGYGSSTGNPLAGGIGGGLSGYALMGTANPAGIILGAVGGIVSGLLEHGRRAQEAARMWRRSLEDFSLMFDELTPAQEKMAANDREFEKLSGGRSRAESDSYLAFLRKWREGLTLLDSPSLRSALDNQIAKYDDLNKRYDENAKQVEALTKAEKDLYDARFTALNAPTGFNLAAFGYRAGASLGQVGAAGKDKDMDVHVTVLLDGEEVGKSSVKYINKQSTRGANPLTQTPR